MLKILLRIENQADCEIQLHGPGYEYKSGEIFISNRNEIKSFHRHWFQLLSQQSMIIIKVGINNNFLQIRSQSCASLNIRIENFLNFYIFSGDGKLEEKNQHRWRITK